MPTAIYMLIIKGTMVKMRSIPCLLPVTKLWIMGTPLILPRIGIPSITLAKIMLETKTFKKYQPEEYRPGLDIKDDEELVKAGSDHTQTIFHPVGTCKMGNDESAVVSDKLKVHGINKLRVIDASIMPNITSGNTNAPTIMIAEKGADMILSA